jgi:dipeptidyl aminopeptidase/acylaminoacyl peptidase
VTGSTSPKPRAGDPFGVGPVGSWLAPTLSIVGLIVVAFLTIGLLNGSLPFVGGSNGNGNGNGTGNGDGDSQRSPAPSNVVIVPEVTFPGSIVYAKAGNIWVQTGKQARQITGGEGAGHDSMPSFSPDGKIVYFIRTTDQIGIWPSQGADRRYQMTVPALMRVNADGSGDPVRVLSGAISKGGKDWFAWIRQPVVAPNRRTMALVSDAPDPANSDVVLQFYDLVSKKRTIPTVAETPPLGHQDPAWRNDGKVLLYVRNGREGTRGAPVIYRWDVAKKTATPLTGPGYLEPSFSPDGRYIAATKTSAFGNDIVILDATRGQELLRITTDGASWSPVWSPTGDSIAFLHLAGQIVDLHLVELEGTAPDWTVGKVIALTEVSGLDGASRPDWFVPADQLPAPPPTPVTSASPSGSPAR